MKSLGKVTVRKTNKNQHQ